MNAPESAQLQLPENASLPTRLRLAVKALGILKNYPTDTIAGPLLNESIDFGVYERLLQGLTETPEGRDLLARRPSLQGPELDLEALAALPESSLGFAFARYFHDNGIGPFSTTNALRNDLDYISKRYRETHDLYHVITGYKTDVAGEMELQAFAMGNLGIRTPLLIVPFGTVTLAFMKDKQPKDFSLVRFLGQLRDAYQKGASSRKFLDFPFEEHWETPLEEVRAMLLAPRTAPAPAMARAA